MGKNDYLGKEKVGKLLVKFAVPCILSLIISCLYNIVDQIFVGNMIGRAANAATGIIFPVTVIGWGISLLFGDGAAAWLSTSLGAQKSERIHKSVGNAMLGTVFFGCILILVAYLWGDGLLRLIGASDEMLEGTDKSVLSYAHEYGIIIYAMIPLALLQNCLAAIIRADGSPLYSMIAMIVGAVLNIAGDPLFIKLTGSISGAAWATIIGQFVSFVICVCYLFKSKTFKLTLRSFIPDFKTLGKIIQLGLSSFLTQLCIVAITIVNNIMLMKFGILAGYVGGEIPQAAFVVIMKLFQIVLNIAIGLAAGAQPIVGYNYGAGHYARVRKLLGLVLAWTTGICLLFTVLFEAAPHAFISIFGGSGGAGGAEYMKFAVPCMRIYLMFITLTCLQKVCAIFLQSIGKARFAAPLSFIRDVVLIIAAIALPFAMGVTGVFWSAPIADAVAAAATVPVMLYVYKSLKANPKPTDDGVSLEENDGVLLNEEQSFAEDEPAIGGGGEVRAEKVSE